MPFKENIIYAVVMAVWIVVKMTYLPLVVFAAGIVVIATSYVLKVVRELRFYHESDNQNLETCETTNPLHNENNFDTIKDNKVVDLDTPDTATHANHHDDSTNPIKGNKVVEDSRIDSGIESRSSTGEIAVLKPSNTKTKKVPLIEGINKADKKGGTKKSKRRTKRSKKTSHQPEIPDDPWMTKPWLTEGVAAVDNGKIHSQFIAPPIKKRVDHVSSPPWLTEGVVAADNGIMRSRFIAPPITVPPDIIL